MKIAHIASRHWINGKDTSCLINFRIIYDYYAPVSYPSYKNYALKSTKGHLFKINEDISKLLIKEMF